MFVSTYHPLFSYHRMNRQHGGVCGRGCACPVGPSAPSIGEVPDRISSTFLLAPPSNTFSLFCHWPSSFACHLWRTLSSSPCPMMRRSSLLPYHPPKLPPGPLLVMRPLSFRHVTPAGTRGTGKRKHARVALNPPKQGRASPVWAR